jgi:hypothetical protein
MFPSAKVTLRKSKHRHVSNGWKGLDIRNKSYVGKKSIWSLEICENWPWSLRYKTCISFLWIFFSKVTNFKPFCSNDASLKWKNPQHQSCIYFQYDQFRLKFCIIWIFYEEFMGTWSWTFFKFNDLGPKWPIIFCIITCVYFRIMKFCPT